MGMDDDWPECEEFFNLMQNYRHARLADPAGTVAAYEAVKDWLRAERTEKTPRSYCVVCNSDRGCNC